MEIKDRIKSLGKYFKTMQVASVDGQQVVYVVVEFPNGWSIGDDIEEKFKVTIANGENPNEYYFCGDIENGFESVFDAIEYNVDMMKEAIERARLLSEKTRELREIFENGEYPIEKLRTLKFEFSEIDENIPIVAKKGRPKKEEKEKTENE